MHTSAMVMQKLWIFALCLLTTAVVKGEIKQGKVGENIIIMEYKESWVFVPHLYHNNVFIALVRGSACDISTDSPFYGRLRCSRNGDNTKIIIEINNVAENDTGLYKVQSEGRDIVQCFLNITGTTVATISNIFTVHEDSKGITPSQPTNVHVNVIAVIIGAVGFLGFIQIMMTGYLIWNQRRTNHITESVVAEQRLPQEECDTALYITALAPERPLPIPPSEERHTGHSNIAQKEKLDASTQFVHVTPRLSNDVYEIVDISNNDDLQNTREHKETMHESTENCNTPFQDTFGYLTVLTLMETTV